MLTALWCLTGAATALLWPTSRPLWRLPAGPKRRGARRPMHVAAFVTVPVAVYAGINPSTGIAVAILAGLLAWWLRRAAVLRREAEATAQLTTALAAITGELAIGAPVPRAFAIAAVEFGTTSETGTALRVMAARAELGGHPDARERHTVGAHGRDGADVAVWARVGQAWAASAQWGIPMRDALDSLRSDLVARQRFHDRTRAGLAGPRATAVVLAALPLLGIALGQALGAAPIQLLLGGGLGGWLLVVGTMLGAGGVVWSLLITDAATRPGRQNSGRQSLRRQSLRRRNSGRS